MPKGKTVYVVIETEGDGESHIVFTDEDEKKCNEYVYEHGDWSSDPEYDYTYVHWIEDYLQEDEDGTHWKVDSITV